MKPDHRKFVSPYKPIEARSALETPAREAVQAVIASARSEWIRSTSRLVFEQPDMEASADEPTGEAGGDDES